MSDDDKDKGKIDSASKTADQAKDQNNPMTGNAPVKLNHGEQSDQAKEDEKAAKKAAKDPWGETPLQQREDHSPEVDPEKVGTTRGGVDASSRSQRLDPMNPSDESASPDQPVKGGTTAPA